MTLTRRSLLRAGLLGAGATLAAPAILRAAEIANESGGLVRRTSGFITHEWQDHFPDLRNGAILCDTEARVLFYWSEDEATTLIYPTSIPLTEDLTRRGRTEVTLKRENPEWRPTPSMLKDNPDLPEYIGPGPENPLGTHALNLGWPNYRIHGTADERKIGRRSSSGCIGLFNEHIAVLFGLARIGTQVELI